MSAITGRSVVNVVPAPAFQLTFTNPTLTLDAGSRGELIGQFEDAYGNPGATSTAAQTISLSTTSSGGAFYATPVSTAPITALVIPAGLSNFSTYYRDTTAGTPTATASDMHSSALVTQVETINPAAVQTFSVTTSFANPDPAGTTGTVTVTAKDAYGNTVGSGPNEFEGTVDVVTTDHQAAGLPASHVFTTADAGSFMFTNVILKTAGHQAITATDAVASTITGTTSVDVTALRGQPTGLHHAAAGPSDRRPEFHGRCHGGGPVQ